MMLTKIVSWLDNAAWIISKDGSGVEELCEDATVGPRPMVCIKIKFYVVGFNP